MHNLWAEQSIGRTPVSSVKHNTSKLQMGISLNIGFFDLNLAVM
jgi:hypothetical protein